MNKLCERAWKLFPFSHSKTAISFNILLVLISDTHIFSGLKLHLQSMQFPVITYGMALYINDSYVYRQNTNMYIRASLENFLAFLHSKTAISFNILLGTSDTLSVQMTCLSAYTCSDKFRNVPTKL